jgi:hypothetical protein
MALRKIIQGRGSSPIGKELQASDKIFLGDRAVFDGNGA